MKYLGAKANHCFFLVFPHVHLKIFAKFVFDTCENFAKLENLSLPASRSERVEDWRSTEFSAPENTQLAASGRADRKFEVQYKITVQKNKTYIINESTGSV